MNWPTVNWSGIRHRVGHEARSGATDLARSLSFLTPLGGARRPTESTLRWFPAAGALIGAVVGGAWWLAGRSWPHLVAGALALLVDLVITGLLHFDGLIDSADGLLPHLQHDRRLAVMKEPRAGAFGIVSAFIVLIIRWSVLASLHPSVPLIAGLWCLSRTAMATVALVVPYARPDGGLATAFLPDDHAAGVRTGLQVAAIGGVAACVLAAFWRPLPGVAAVAAAGLGSLAVAGFALERIGGFTGDVLGAAGVIGETVGLVVAAVKW